MREVKWRGRKGPVCHCIYTKAEADTLGLKYLDNWRDGKLNDWVLTEDDHVVQIIRYAEDHYGRGIAGTCTMTVMNGAKNHKLDTLEKVDRYAMNGQRRKKRGREITKMNSRIRHFCLIVASGTSPEDAYRIAFKGRNKSRVMYQTALMMRSEIVKNEIKNQMGELLEKEGITKSWILQQYKNIIMYGDKDAPKVVALNKLSQFHSMDKMIEKQDDLPELPAGVASNYKLTEAVDADVEEPANEEENVEEALDLVSDDSDNEPEPSGDTSVSEDRNTHHFG